MIYSLQMLSFKIISTCCFLIYATAGSERIFTYQNQRFKVIEENLLSFCFNTKQLFLIVSKKDGMLLSYFLWDKTKGMGETSKKISLSLSLSLF